MSGTRQISLKPGADLPGFRQAVRSLIACDVKPADVFWTSANIPELFGTAMEEKASAIALPRNVSDLIELVICHRDPERHALLYTLIWRVYRGERHILELHHDPVVNRLEAMAKEIRRDLHKMHAFLRFRLVLDAKGTEHYVAWFEPDNFILEAAAPFFIERFRSLQWSILTPIGSLLWNREALRIGPAAERSDAPADDDLETAWQCYYENVFNPARVNKKAMLAEMPKKYWRNMAEARAIPALIQSAPARTQQMIEREASMPVKRNPEKAVAAMADQEPKTLGALNRLIATSDPLVPGATKAVLGEGPIGARIAFVGEQPGDQEDREGHPFVGPAGQLLDRAMAEAGIDRADVYVTNAVKHFKFEQRGKRRIHQKPTTGEVKHYRWWLMKELSFVKPHLVVALGGTAALALTGKPVSVTKMRGKTEFDGFDGYITVHPSYLLRLPDEETKAEAYAAFCTDLKHIRKIAA